MVFYAPFINLIVVYLSVNIVVSVPADNCWPGSNCLTCPADLPYHCTSCKKGYIHKRNGAYMSCERCSVVCADCYSTHSCSKCDKGRFGLSCQNVCANGCINSTCNIESGNCECKDNFTGASCDRCVSGNYGYDFDNCQFKCSSNYAGENCSECARGFYGAHCSEICPENCESCSSGSACNGCKLGMWGAVCERNCSYGCLNEACTQDLGVCNNTACKPGFVGDQCTNCSEGLRGPHCNVTVTYNDTVPSSTNVHVNTSN